MICTKSTFLLVAFLNPVTLWRINEEEEVLEEKVERGSKLIQQGSADNGIRLLRAMAEELEERVRLNPADSSVLQHLGRIYVLLDQDDQAVRCFDRAIKFDPENAEPHFFRALVNSYSGRLSEAERGFEKATQLDPKNSRYWFELGRVHELQSAPGRALASFRKVIELDPDNAEALFRVGNAEVALGKSEHGLASWLMAFEIDPEFVSAAYNAGQAYQDLGDYEQALKLFLRVVSLDRLDWRGLAKLVQLYDALGRTEERDQARRSLLSLRASGCAESLRHATQFCRDQFTVGEKHILAMELFEPCSQEYFFRVLGHTEEEASYDIAYGACQSEEIGKDARHSHLYAYNPVEKHEIYLLVDQKMAYDDVKKLVVAELDRRIEGQLSFESTGVPSPSDVRDNNNCIDRLRLAKANELMGRASACEATGDYADATSLALNSLQLRRAALGPGHSEVIKGMNHLAKLYINQGDFSSARSVLNRALDVVGESEGIMAAVTRQHMALTLKKQGDLRAALVMYRQAVRAFERILGPGHPHTAIVSDNLANVLQARGDNRAARRIYEHSLAVFEQSLGSEHLHVATCLANLGLLLSAQGDDEIARQMLRRSLNICEAQLGLHHPTAAIVRDNLASVLDYDLARPLCENALRVLEEKLGPGHLDVATASSNLAFILMKHGDYSEAESLVRGSHRIREEAHGPGHPIVAASLAQLGAFQMFTGRYDEARRSYESALEGLKGFSPHPLVARVLNELGSVHWLMGDLDGARKRFLQSSRILATHTQELLPSLSFAEQLMFLERTTPNAVSLLLSSCREGLQLREAYSMIIRWKGRLTDVLRYYAALNQFSLGPEGDQQLAQLNALRSRISAVYHSFGSLPSDQWRETLESLMQQKEAVERSLRGAGTINVGWNPESGRDGLLANLIRAADARQGLLDIGPNELDAVLESDEAFVDVYHYTSYEKGKYSEDRYAAILSGREHGPVLVDLGSSLIVDAAVESWREGVLGSERGNVPWNSLVEVIWKPLVNALPGGVTKIWVSPDRELARVPWNLFGALDPSQKQIQAAQIHTIKDVYRLRLKKLQRSLQKEPSEKKAKQILLVGGVNFDADVQGSESDKRFARLDGTLPEVKALASLSMRHNLSVTLLTGEEATKREVVSILPEVAFAHLSTHGLFDKAVHGTTSFRGGELLSPVVRPERALVRNPLILSGLVLAGGNNLDPVTKEATGVLTAEELVGLDLSQCELITLAACNTGRGQEVSGQGVMGLWASVAAAGARSTVMSLWKVPDRSTMRLMKEFYTNLWEKKLPKLEALWEAQRSLRDHSSGKFKPPIHWAGWIIAGEAW